MLFRLFFRCRWCLCFVSFFFLFLSVHYCWKAYNFLVYSCVLFFEQLDLCFFRSVMFFFVFCSLFKFRFCGFVHLYSGCRFVSLPQLPAVTWSPHLHPVSFFVRKYNSLVSLFITGFSHHPTCFSAHSLSVFRQQENATQINFFALLKTYIQLFHYIKKKFTPLKNLIFAPSINGTKLDTSLIVFKASAVWMIVSHFIWRLWHWCEICVTILP